MTPSRRPLRSRNQRWANELAQFLARRRVAPNAISIAGVAAAFVAAACYAGSVWMGALAPVGFAIAAGCIQFRLLCNLMDGMVAMEGGLKGRGGDFFNEAPDRLADILFLAGAGCAAGHDALGWMAAAAAVLTAYVRVFGASLGQEQDFCGPMAKQQRMFFLTIGSLAGAFYLPALYWALWLIAIGAFLTAARRALRLYRKMP